MEGGELPLVTQRNASSSSPRWPTGGWASWAAAEESQGKSKIKIHLGKGVLPLCQLLERPSAPLASPFWDTDTSPAVNLGVVLTEPMCIGANKGESLCEAAVYKDKVQKEEGNQSIYDLFKGNPRVFLLHYFKHNIFLLELLLGFFWGGR